MEPSPTARWERLALVAGAVAVGALILAFVRGHHDGLYDDAFIYLRYVKNVAAGCGLRWNCGDPPVEGFTGPLYLAALCGGRLLTAQLIDLATGICTASLVAATTLAVAFAGRLGRGTAHGVTLPIALALALGLDPFLHLNAVNGMETALAIAVFTLVALAAITRRPRLLVAALIAGLLTRPEGALYLLALPLLPWMRRWRHLAPLAVAVVAIVVARYAIFGELVPNTYLAKSGGTARHAALGLAYVADALADFPLAFLAPLALIALPRGDDRGAARYLVVVAVAWLAFFLRSGGDLFDYSRLFVPLVPALSALGLAGLAALPARLGLRRATAVGGALALGAGLLTGGRAAIVHAIPPQGASARVLQWAATGLYLRAHYPGQLIATVPIGAIGYYSGLPVLDLVGLTEPAIAHAGRGVPPELLTKLWIGHERHDTAHVLARQPAVIVTTMHRATPWRELAEARAGFYADWLLLQEIKAGRAPYHVVDAEVTPGDHVLMFARD
jgi:hypothetical protein